MAWDVRVRKMWDRPPDQPRPEPSDSMTSEWFENLRAKRVGSLRT